MRMVASGMVEKALEVFVYGGVWPFPSHVQKPLLRALRRSSCSRVATLKLHLALADYCDFRHFLASLATPEFMMRLVDDLVATGALSRRDGSLVQETLLTGIHKDGTWMYCIDYEERHA